MSDHLSQGQKDEYKVVFEFFDKQNTGRLSSKDVVTMMKALGEAVTDAELKSLCKGGDSLDLNSFIQNREEKWAREQSGEEVKAAFQVFDAQNTGKISAEDFKYIMTNLGETMTASEADEMVREAGGGPSIDYNAFVDKMKRKT
eukprot:TRINITY_DN2809_c0_g1_i1.p1 TRINITY_DN2809_c0_g1~~TRINITY_DN2809_c0_g1_i1.p1  ORF type:complete len:166 (-),score=61.48 TRINITY_DN2809_c0_g1_i1:577-1008(-)